MIVLSYKILISAPNVSITLGTPRHKSVESLEIIYRNKCPTRKPIYNLFLLGEVEEIKQNRVTKRGKRP